MQPLDTTVENKSLERWKKIYDVVFCSLILYVFVFYNVFINCREISVCGFILQIVTLKFLYFCCLHASSSGKETIFG